MYDVLQNQKGDKKIKIGHNSFWDDSRGMTPTRIKEGRHPWD